MWLFLVIDVWCLCVEMQTMRMSSACSCFTCVQSCAFSLGNHVSNRCIIVQSRLSSRVSFVPLHFWLQEVLTWWCMFGRWLARCGWCCITSSGCIWGLKCHLPIPSKFDLLSECFRWLVALPAPSEFGCRRPGFCAAPLEADSSRWAVGPGLSTWDGSWIGWLEVYFVTWRLSLCLFECESLDSLLVLLLF